MIIQMKGTVYLATKWDNFNNTDDNLFDNDIPDADSMKTEKSMHGKYMSYGKNPYIRILNFMLGKVPVWRII